MNRTIALVLILVWFMVANLCYWIGFHQGFNEGEISGASKVLASVFHEVRNNE